MTDALVLKPLTASAVRAHHVDWLNDKEVVAFSEQRHRHHHLRGVRQYVMGFDGNTSHIWAIVRAADNKHIGNITSHADTHNYVANVGILIGEKSAWGKGFGRQAWAAVCNWLLDPKENPNGYVYKVEAGCMATNVGMRRVFDLTGMQYEGERRGHFLVNGAHIGKVLYGRIK